MFTPQTFPNIFTFFQQSETVKTKKMQQVTVQKQHTAKEQSTVIQGAEAAWQDQIHNGPLSQLKGKTAMNRNTDPRHRVATFRP